MFFDGFIRPVGALESADLQPLERLLSEHDLTEPGKFTRRERPLVGGKLLTVIHGGRVKHGPAHRQIRRLLKRMNDIHPDRVIYRVEIAGYEPGHSALVHHDSARFHKNSVRLHLPVVTNPGVRFYSRWWHTENAFFKYRMEPARIYEFNNRVPHAVVNGGDLFRVHVIVDLIEEAEIANSPHARELVLPETPEFVLGTNTQGTEPVTSVADLLEVAALQREGIWGAK